MNFMQKMYFIVVSWQKPRVSFEAEKLMPKFEFSTIFRILIVSATKIQNDALYKDITDNAPFRWECQNKTGKYMRCEGCSTPHTSRLTRRTLGKTLISIFLYRK